MFNCPVNVSFYFWKFCEFPRYFLHKNVKSLLRIILVFCKTLFIQHFFTSSKYESFMIYELFFQPLAFTKIHWRFIKFILPYKAHFSPPLFHIFVTKHCVFVCFWFSVFVFGWLRFLYSVNLTTYEIYMNHYQTRIHKSREIWNSNNKRTFLNLRAILLWFLNFCISGFIVN